jgi:2-oxo-4-hydroxy-4-carboxy-5-ureidoimidazoline decarboxylase
MLEGTTRSSVATLNEMDRAAFVALLGGVYEHSPWVAAEAWDSRPFADIDELHRAMTAVVERAGRDKKVGLLAAHPELSGREAEAGELTVHSEAEQASAGLGALAPDEAARIRSLNARYRRKFGFPFVIAVRRHTKASIFREMERRLRNGAENELADSLAQVFAIARLRLDDLVSDEHPPT